VRRAQDIGWVHEYSHALAASGRRGGKRISMFKNNKIIALQDREIISVTGGDTHPILMPSFKGGGKLTLNLNSVGNYTLSEVQVTIIDQGLASLLEEKHLDARTVSNQSRYVIKICNFGPNRVLPGTPLQHIRFA
jgi:hypothetical protein